VTKTYWTTE